MTEYIKPETEIIELSLENPILDASKPGIDNEYLNGEEYYD